MKLIKKILLGLLFSPLFFALSCSQKPFFQETIILKNSIWERFDIKSISFPIEKENETYTINLKMKTNASFAYDEYPVYVILTTPAGEERMREVTLKINKISGSTINEGSTILWKDISIANKGKCKITIENQIPKYETPGVEWMSIEVEQNK